MREIKSNFLILKEFIGNTQIEKIHTSLCLPMDQQPIVLSYQNEGCAFVFSRTRDKVTFQIIEYPYTDLLQSIGMMHFLVFLDHEHIFSGHPKFLGFHFF